MRNRLLAPQEPPPKALLLGPAPPHQQSIAMRNRLLDAHFLKPLAGEMSFVGSSILANDVLEVYYALGALAELEVGVAFLEQSTRRAVAALEPGQHFVELLDRLLKLALPVVALTDPIDRVVASSCGRTRETATIIFGDSITINTDSFDAKLRDDSNTSNRMQKTRLHDVVVDLATDLRRNTNAAVVAHSTSVNCLDDQLGSGKQSGLGRRVKNCQEKIDGLDSAGLNEGDAWIVDATSNPPIVIGRLTAKNWKSNRRVAKTEATTYCRDNL